MLGAVSRERTNFIWLRVPILNTRGRSNLGLLSSERVAVTNSRACGSSSAWRCAHEYLIKGTNNSHDLKRRAAALLWGPGEIRYRKTESSAGKDVCENLLTTTQIMSAGKHAVL